ncbi:MAG: aldo/keto reductase [Eubacteriales bacterium]|nr:aldo/keto reductase [Eubacteriales bacterium]MDD4324148.1 aldo/keto reductase [Eubacteriales bacterium]MDD4540960.1 aldo/keto reductase [Eubacteriales bacterium]
MEKKLAFGFMRLPETKDGKIDFEQTKAMVDRFIGEGFSYFDTAYGYHDQQSEIAIRECLTKRYKRNKFQLTDKLSSSYFETEEDLPGFFAEQLEKTGVDYFDSYLIHALNRKNYDKFLKANAFEFLKKLKSEGKVKRIGFSFHDTAEFLDQLLTDHPEIEVVQLQFNYLDFHDPEVQSYDCYQVCEKHKKTVLVMEPVQGGNLASLPPQAREVFDKFGTGASYASYAVRFAASFPLVEHVLSGMSNMDQLVDNVSYMKDFRPLTGNEYVAVDEVREILMQVERIPCTSCEYCLEGCPTEIPIPDVIALLNEYNKTEDKSVAKQYEELVRARGRASECISCAACEEICPQHLEIMRHMEEATAAFE